MFRFVLGSLFCLLVLSSCFEKKFDLIVFNTLQQPVEITGLDTPLEVPSGTSVTVPTPMTEGTTVILKSNNKVLETLVVGQAELATPEHGILYIAGGPRSFAIANYSSFYGTEPGTAITDVSSLRKQKFYALKANEEVWLPEVGHTKLPEGLKEGHILKRVVPIPPPVPDARIQDYLNAEFKAFSEPAQK